MVALIILGVIALIIFGIMMVPVGADVAYEGGEFRLSAKVCGILLQLLPKPPVDESKPKKEPKPKKEKKQKKQKPEGEKKPKKKLSLNFSKEELFALVKAVLKGLGKFRKMSVDRFLLHYIAAGDDPYNTAQTYGFVNAALSALAPICAKRFNVKESDVWTDVDFTAEKMSLDAGVAISIRIGQIFAVINTIVFGALWILIKNKVRLLKEKLFNKSAKPVKAAKAA